HTHVIKKVNNNYAICIQEMFLDNEDYDNPEINEHFEVYETLSEVLEIFKNKYNILPENLNTSRGNKFFNEIKLVRYIGETKSLMLTHNKIYNVIFTEKNWFRIMDDSGEDYLYPPELFEEI
ncbi:MAG: hypothetical protein K2J32_03185, partial [Ruminococcus sp.]|nr:hypothetical protein [Ruminococcus sp.]